MMFNTPGRPTSQSSQTPETDAASKRRKTRAGLAVVKPMTFIAGFLLALVAGQAFGATITKADFGFVNVTDSTVQGLLSFGPMPAINNAGAVAFVATSAGSVKAVFKWQNGVRTNIATSGDVFSNFGDAVVINAAGVVGFDAAIPNGGEKVILTSDGYSTKTIVDSIQQGLLGGPFLGISSINASGTVTFLGVRSDGSRAIFAGNGGPLVAVVDTANSSFDTLGNSAISASGEVAFLGSREDGSEGIYAGPGGATVIVDTNNPNFVDFLDPVINDAGVVADGAFLSNGAVEVITGNGRAITARTYPASPFFAFIDNVTINNRSVVAFFADEASGGQGIFIEITGGDSPVALIEVGDALFGSTVTSVNLGRFSLNTRNQVVFQYNLQDGRSGIAIASLQSH
jgi:hypothetical protein